MDLGRLQLVHRRDMTKYIATKCFKKIENNKFLTRGHIFCCVRPFYERAGSNLDRPMHRSLWTWVTHSSFKKGSHMTKYTATKCFQKIENCKFLTRGHIFCCVRPFCEQALSNLDRPMHRSLWTWVAHSSFIEGSHMTNNTASGLKK
jgi:hypothetical protein